MFRSDAGQLAHGLVSIKSSANDILIVRLGPPAGPCALLRQCIAGPFFGQKAPSSLVMSRRGQDVVYIIAISYAEAYVTARIPADLVPRGVRLAPTLIIISSVISSAYIRLNLRCINLRDSPHRLVDARYI